MSTLGTPYIKLTTVARAYLTIDFMLDIFMSFHAFFELFSLNRRHSWHTFYFVALVVLSGKITFPSSLRLTTTSFGR